MQMVSPSSIEKRNKYKTLDELYIIKGEYEEKLNHCEKNIDNPSPFGKDGVRTRISMYKQYLDVINKLIEERINNNGNFVVSDEDRIKSDNDITDAKSIYYKRDNPILERIRINLIDGELPRKFKINPFNSGYIDGALDGIDLLNNDKTYLSEIQYKLMIDILDTINANREDAIEKLIMFLSKIPVIKYYDEVKEYLMEHRDRYNPSNLADFVFKQLQNSNNVEVIKYCLCILELLGANKVDKVKDIVRTLALCNEFTFYTIPIINHWDDSETELFNIVKKVYGWGRIFIIENFRNPSKEVENWLITEGLNNDVQAVYSATAIFQILNIEEKIENCSIQELEQYIKIIKLMLEDNNFSRFLLLKRYPNTAYKLKTKIQNLNLESKYPELMNLLNEFIDEYLKNTSSDN